MKWTEEMQDELRERWNAGERSVDIRSSMALSDGQLRGAIMRFHLHTRRAGFARVLDPAHPASASARTLFPSRVEFGAELLRSGYFAVKLGGRVTKAAWRGMPIFALTLEERASCPRSCALWDGCYGNNMPWAKRAPHGAEFERRLWLELQARSRKHPNGFVVRLHVLGDFYSVGYVEFWRRALVEFPALHCFGYTARLVATRIGNAVRRLSDDNWDRFAIRGSGAPYGPRSLVVDSPEKASAGSIVCPAQTGLTQSCATCGLCWASAARDRPIAFLRH